MTLFNGELYLLKQQDLFKYSHTDKKMQRQFEDKQFIDIWNSKTAIILAAADAVFSYNDTLN